MWYFVILINWCVLSKNLTNRVRYIPDLGVGLSTIAHQTHEIIQNQRNTNYKEWDFQAVKPKDQYCSWLDWPNRFPAQARQNAAFPSWMMRLSFDLELLEPNQNCHLWGNSRETALRVPHFPNHINHCNSNFLLLWLGTCSQVTFYVGSADILVDWYVAFPKERPAEFTQNIGLPTSELCFRSGPATSADASQNWEGIDSWKAT